MCSLYTSLYGELTVSFAFAGRGAQIGALGIGVVLLTSDREAFVPFRAGLAFARASCYRS